MTVASTAKLPKLSKPLAKATALQLSVHVLGHSARAAPASLATALGAAGGTSRWTSREARRCAARCSPP